MPATEATLRDRLEDRFWARHSNPISGWTRTLSMGLKLRWVDELVRFYEAEGA